MNFIDDLIDNLFASLSKKSRDDIKDNVKTIIRYSKKNSVDSESKQNDENISQIMKAVAEDNHQSMSTIISVFSALIASLSVVISITSVFYETSNTAAFVNIAAMILVIFLPLIAVCSYIKTAINCTNSRNMVIAAQIVNIYRSEIERADEKNDESKLNEKDLNEGVLGASKEDSNRD